MTYVKKIFCKIKLNINLQNIKEATDLINFKQNINNTKHLPQQFLMKTTQDLVGLVQLNNKNKVSQKASYESINSNNPSMQENEILQFNKHYQILNQKCQNIQLIKNRNKTEIQQIQLENQEMESFIHRLKIVCEDQNISFNTKVQRIKQQCDELFEQL